MKCLDGQATAIISPSDYFEDFESDTGFGGELYVCYEEFLGAEYQNKAYVKTLMSPEEFIVYLNDVTPTEIPSGIYPAMCKACQHCFENEDGRGNCGYYEENVNPENPIDDCAHFANNNEYDIYHLLYDEMYVVKNIQAEEDITVLDIVKFSRNAVQRQNRMKSRVFFCCLITTKNFGVCHINVIKLRPFTRS